MANLSPLVLSEPFCLSDVNPTCCESILLQNFSLFFCTTIISAYHSMSVTTGLRATWPIPRALNARSFASSSIYRHGRTAAYRRLLVPHSITLESRRLIIPSTILTQKSSHQTYTLATYQRVPILYNLPASRTLHTFKSFLQQAQQKEDVKDPPRSDQSSEAKTESTSDKSREDSEKESTEEEPSEAKKDSKKEDVPPPPPHGDKSPWQVFTETLRTEFKASKEWNESTKQLASSAHQFSESESVRRARAAYEATVGAGTTKTASAIKGTGKALGQGAAWTWDTKVVQGVRQGINATGRGIEKATRPVRETQAFQNMKEAVDDGSSSRYGGWVEKEERRKKKELRELREMQSGRRPTEKVEEDPK